jgi:hypothetical protein
LRAVICRWLNWGISSDKWPMRVFGTSILPLLTRLNGRFVEWADLESAELTVVDCGAGAGSNPRRHSA